MGSRTKCYSFLLVGLVLLLACSVVGCATLSPKTSRVESYLDDIKAIIDEATNTALEVSSLYYIAEQLDSYEVVQRCAIYGEAYDDLFARLIALECPEECSKLREYTIDAIYYSKQEVTEFGASFATGDIEHLYEAEYYYNEAQKAIALAAGEWDRLNQYQR